MTTTFHQPTDRSPAGPADRFELEVRQLPGATEVAVDGELCLVSVPVLARCIDRIVAAGERRVILDLTDLTFVDASGLSAFVRAGRRLHDVGGVLELRSPRPWPYEVMTVTRVTDTLDVVDPPG